MSLMRHVLSDSLHHLICGPCLLQATDIAQGLNTCVPHREPIKLGPVSDLGASGVTVLAVEAEAL